MPSAPPKISPAQTQPSLILALFACAVGRRSGADPHTSPSTSCAPGMVGVGRTVFEGDRLDEFKVHILGVLRNVIGPAAT